MSQFQNAFAVVLAGGVGSRFWPASRPDRPKQLLSLATDRPLIADAVERAIRMTGPARTLVVAGRHLVEPFRRALPELSSDSFLVEPEARGTGPALAWAAHEIARRQPDATMISLHADHVIDPLAGFLEAVERGVGAADDGLLFCLGIRPSRPEIGYGYIELGRELGPGIHRAAAFIEKPSLERARAFLSAGHYLWNSGIFIWRAADLLAAVRRHAPEIRLDLLDAGDVDGFFHASGPVSIDVAVMERSDRVGVVSCSFRWDDVGGWNALHRTRPADGHDNVVVGPADLVESAGNVVWSENGHVTLFRVRDLVVVHSDAHTFVTTREAAAEMKRIFERSGDLAPDAAVSPPEDA
ncbi:MAG: mannose-1-phosphate guanylyltransferase [Gemmatimonadota bacterium]|nr:MAG: mannose-1-phosphate guanylyltransferase [Gemmatimonadota bacterium]